jgi:hypothetical protein
MMDARTPEIMDARTPGERIRLSLQPLFGHRGRGGLIIEIAEPAR